MAAIRAAWEHTFVCSDAAPGAFYAGLIAGEGSFGITHNNAGRSWICTFSLTMRADDTPLLMAARRWFGVGRLRAVPARGNSRPQTVWRITRRSDCAVMAETLQDLPLLGKKEGEFRVWRSAVQAWIDAGDSRAHVLSSHAEHLGAQRTSHEESDFTGVDITVLYLEAFLSGFATAEAHFGTSRAGTPSFTINLRADDAPLLRLMQRRFGVGHVACIPPRASSRPGSSWRIGKRSELRRLAGTLDRVPPRGRAGRVYGAWRHLVLPNDHPPERRRAMAADVVAARVYEEVPREIDEPDRSHERRTRCRAALMAWVGGETTPPYTAMAYERWRLDRRASTPSRNTVAAAFGSWRDALRAIGIGSDDALPTRSGRPLVVPSARDHERTARVLAQVLALAESLPTTHEPELRFPRLPGTPEQRQVRPYS